MFPFTEKFNFKVGQPPDTLMFPEFLEQSLKYAMEKMKDNDEYMYTYRFLNYGKVEGDLSLRKELANWLTKDLMFSVKPDNLFITGGVSQSFDILCSRLLKPADNVLIEGPSYFLALKIFGDHYVNIHTVLRGENGRLDMDEVEKTIVERNIKMFYTIPTCHNPMACHLPLEQRNQLYNLGLKYKCFIICDDIYEQFYYDQGKTRKAPLFFCSDSIIAQKEFHRKQIFEYEPSSNPYIISLNSFNKLINPGMRIGWILADSLILNQIKSLGWMNSGGGMCNTMGHIVRSYMQLGFFEKVIEATRKDFSERINICDEILNGSKAFSYELPTWGYFYWLKLSNKVNLEKLKSLLTEEDLLVLFGESCLADSEQSKEKFAFLKRRIRVCFVRYPIDKIKEGFALLRKLIENSLDE